jgi:hypothetical protein
MKTIRQSVRIFIIMLIASACATSPATIPPKYNLDNQLENVPNISRFKIMSWDNVDNQSFVLQTGPNDYYLIVLESMCHTLPFASTIKISDDRSPIWPSYSNVIVNDDGWEDSYMINRIYKFKDYTQVEAIRAILCREAK